MKLKLKKRNNKDSISKIILIELQKDIFNNCLKINQKNLSKIKNNFFVLSEGIVLNKKRAKQRLLKLNNETYNFDKKDFDFINCRNENLNSEEIINFNKYSNVFGISTFYLFVEDDFVTPYQMFHLNFKEHADNQTVKQRINRINHILKMVDKTFEIDTLQNQKFYNYFAIHEYSRKTSQNYIQVMYDLFSK